MPGQSGSASLRASGSAVMGGLVVERTPYGYNRVVRYMGEKTVPAEIRRRRRYVHDMLRRLGTPVIIKHRFNATDVGKGIAIPSENMDPVYGQPRNADPISHGTGFASAELSGDEWIAPDGSAIVSAEETPGPGYTQAPKYRGYGPGYLTYIITPDAPIDLIEHTPQGVLYKTQDARAIAGWFPDMNDNDLLIMVELDKDGNAVEFNERYELKQQFPVTMRGNDKRGRRENKNDVVGGNRYKVNQNFELILIPQDSGNPVYDVETDR